MKNKIRSRAYFKIKRSINSCETAEQLDTALTMIAAHPDIAETNLLHGIYNEKIKDLQAGNGGTEAGDELTHPHASTFGEKFEKAAQREPKKTFEDETLTEIHKKLSI